MTAIGEYDLVRELGRGAMGEVWLARHRRLQREVALKLIHGVHAGEPALLERFRREAQAAMRISHPGVVRVFDFGDEGGRFYLAMELLAGGSDLGQVLAPGPLPLA